ncbi:MAG: PEGA domain-containing protein [Myxococcaceae bacterium]
MKAFVASLSLLLSLNAFAQADQAPPKVTVVPFAALSGDVPQRAGQKAAAMLSNELKNLDTVQYVAPQKSSATAVGGDKLQDGITHARQLVDEAKDERQKRKFKLASDTLDKALAEYRTNAAGLQDVAELSDAYALLSAVLYNTGRDEEGQKALVTAVSFAPSRELPLAATSPLFSRVVLDMRKQVQLAQKGSIVAESTPSGAAVTLDGVNLGATPLEIKDVPPGQHVWRVNLPSGELVGGVVEVAAGKQAKVSGQASGLDPESRALATLAQNKLDEPTLKALADYGRANEVDNVLFGGISRDGKNLALDAFVYSLLTNEVRRLPRMSFDTELLSAGMEFYNLAGELSKAGLKVGELTRAPTAVSSQALIGTNRVAVATYGIPVG